MSPFHVPVNIYFNLAAAVFDLVLLIFLDLQYGNTTKHSRAFRNWLFATMFASFADVPLHALASLTVVPHAAARFGFWLSFSLIELSVVAMLRYIYIYCRDKKNKYTNVMVVAGILAAVVITGELFFGNAQFVVCFISFFLYICFLAVESRDYRQISILMERVEKENQEARYEIDQKEKLFSDVSEKISLPLHLIRVDAMHIEQVSGKSQSKEYARQILSSEEMLSFLIRDIFDMVSLNGRNLQLNERRFHLSELLNDIRNMMTTMAKENGLFFEVTTSSDVPDVWVGDDDRLKQILINLIGNGIKYTKEGGVSLYVTVDDNMSLQLTVYDTGIGIRKEDIPYLFEKYHRFDKKKNEHIQGTGLGLSIVSSLVNRMNGNIEVKSRYGEGSQFIVTLPLKVGGRITIKRGSFLDTKAGLSYFCNSIADYRTVLNIFLDYAPHLEEELKGLYGQPAADIYNVCHPLAYMALNIGAMELAGRAFSTQREETRKTSMEEIIPVLDETVYRIREYLESIKFM
ncbi:MAG: hypothetical protein IIU07_06435 [Lachnospiraceae bacterium]|nr:hypothetical protein [Lachnospiraceae bacterium]MBQ5534919.1 hypothetical protein [Lachnospiraceae bacterium]